jgi:serine/threonine-protein kinase
MRNCLKCKQVFDDHHRYCPEDGRLLEEADPRVGAVIDGSFRLGQRLGQGAMGAVYKGWQLSFERPVAVKILNRELRHRSVIVERFRREARALAMLDHPSIAKVYSVGECDDGLPYFAMEFVAGRPLRDLVGSLSRAEIIELVEKIAFALVVAHGAGLVHRDLKPENIMVVRQPDELQVKILDFGIAKFQDEQDGELTRAGDIYGTPHYLSPEQAMGGEVDARSDLYSLGVVMYELLVGRPPYEGDGMTAILAHLHAPVPSLRGFGALGALAERLMAKQPADRLQTAAQVARELERLRQRRGADTRLLLETAPARRSHRRARGALVAASVALVALASSSLLWQETSSAAESGSAAVAHSQPAEAIRPAAREVPSVQLVPREAHFLVKEDYSLRVLVPEAARVGESQQIIIELWDAADRPLDEPLPELRLEGGGSASRDVGAAAVATSPGQYVLELDFDVSGSYRLSVAPAPGEVLGVHFDVLERDQPSS